MKPLYGYHGSEPTALTLPGPSSSLTWAVLGVLCSYVVHFSANTFWLHSWRCYDHVCITVTAGGNNSNFYFSWSAVAILSAKKHKVNLKSYIFMSWDNNKNIILN